MADLSSKVFGINFRNPVMPAAGPNVKSSSLMIKSAELGAGAVVSKTFSVKAANDPRPTMKKTLAGGLLNCETWLEDSYENFFQELARVKNSIGRDKNKDVPLIVSIGYSAEDVDFLGRLLEEKIRPDAIEFSTHYTGHEISPLISVAKSLKSAVDVPVLMKLSPGFPNIEELALAAEPHVDGFVAVNSYGPALDFDPKQCKKALGSDWGQGWMSGPPLFPIALGIVCRLARVLSKPIIGVGGITSGEEAVKLIMAGASLVQLCTSAIFEGPGAYGRIAAEISAWLDENGYNNISEIQGKYLNTLG